MKRTCTSCGVIKPLSDFYQFPPGRDGHDSRCKVCKNKKRIIYQKIRREKEKQIRLEKEKTQVSKPVSKQWKQPEIHSALKEFLYR